MQGILNIIKNPLTIFKNIAEFFQEQLNKENGVRSLALMLLTIPSICLLILYHMERVENEELKASNLKLTIEIRENEKKLVTLKDSLRKDLMNDFVNLAKSVKNLQNILDDDNSIKSKKIKKYSEEVDNEIQKVE